MLSKLKAKLLGHFLEVIHWIMLIVHVIIYICVNVRRSDFIYPTKIITSRLKVIDKNVLEKCSL